MLEHAGLNPIVAGNIGTPLCEAAEQASPDNWMVVELSSFQLKGTVDFRPRIASLLNVAETHLDYHGDLDDYVASKAKLFANQQPDDVAILNWDDAVCRGLVPYIKGRLLPFSMIEKLDVGVYADPPYVDGEEDDVKRQMIYADEKGNHHTIIDIENIGIAGRFNVENAMAAVAIAVAAGADPAVLVAPLADFKAVEHRLEYVLEHNGSAYYNNSKATNSKATVMALNSFKEPVVLIAGGLDRGSDMMELLPLFQERVKAVVAIGETRTKIAKVAELAGLKQIKVVDNEEDAARTLTVAVQEASKLASAGDVVLLSPACASWDMFASYEERGRIFKEAAHNL